MQSWIIHLWIIQLLLLPRRPCGPTLPPFCCRKVVEKLMRDADDSVIGYSKQNYICGNSVPPPVIILCYDSESPTRPLALGGCQQPVNSPTIYDKKHSVIITLSSCTRDFRPLVLCSYRRHCRPEGVPVNVNILVKFSDPSENRLRVFRIVKIATTTWRTCRHRHCCLSGRLQ